jgi:hypothetical protein
LENFIGGFDPYERLWLLVANGNVSCYGVLKLIDTAMAAAANLFLGQFAKPPFNQIQPRSTGWREVQVKMRPFDQPALNHCRLMSSVVVKDDMDIKTIGDIVFYKIKEFAEFNTAMPPVTFPDHFACSCIKSCKK